jgi:hypothetical protein
MTDITTKTVGLGYVGLPWPLNLAKSAAWWALTSTKSASRAEAGHDFTLETEPLKNSKPPPTCAYSTQLDDLRACNVLHRHRAHPY